MKLGHGLLSCGLVALAAAPSACTDPAGPTRPNVILITLDTVRADHLSVYGYPLRTTPSLAALAQEATLWTNAQSTAPWTVPAHASLFTGLYPFEHGCRSFETDRPGMNLSPLADAQRTLAEALSELGYRTAAFVTNDVFLGRRLNLHQGFAEYSVQREYAAPLNERVFAWLANQREQPFFLFLNYMDAHRPYNSAERPGLLPRPVGSNSGELLKELYEPVMLGERDAHAEALQRLVDQYDTAIANLDEELGRLFEELRRLGLYDDTLIVVTSDHGEYFGEHALIEHCKDVYQEALWVPLIVKRPGQERGQVREERISLAFVPRLIGPARAPPPPLPAGAAHGSVVAENYFARPKDLFDQPWGDRFHRVRQVLYDGVYKYIHSSDGRHELYDLEADPAEAHNLADTRPGRLAEMQELLAVALAAGSQADAPSGMEEFTQQELEVLKELGYY